jgi:hypothetical protein
MPLVMQTCFAEAFPRLFHPGTLIPRCQTLAIDFPLRRSNNPRMARPDAVRRVKSYSAANGLVYQYFFFEVNRTADENGPAGEFIYAVTSDRKNSFGLRVLVRQSALQEWARTNGRPLTSSEEYAIAKMRLFQGFDAGEVPPTAESTTPITLCVDESNLEELLQSLNI